MPVRVLSVAVLACAVLNLRAVFTGDQLQEFVFKPLTTAMVIAVAMLVRAGPGASWRPAIVAGLACSLAGDVFLMLPGGHFLAGLGSFLVAHVCYIAAFTREGWRVGPAPALSCGVYVMVLIWWLLPHAGAPRVPVAAYALVIGTMAWQAVERWRDLRTPAALAAAAGAVLFVLSDTALAVNRFVAPFALAPLAVMGTYVPAQWFIALSAGRGRP